MTRLVLALVLAVFVALGIFPSPILAKTDTALDQDQQRMEMFQRMGSFTGVPWYFLAAVDQYERNITKSKSKKELLKKRTLSIQIPSEIWGGPLNPDPNEQRINTIKFFGGIGRDGSGDEKADPENDLDVLFSFASYLGQYGYSEDDIRIGLWEYYHRDKAVDLISEYAQIYQTFQTLKLSNTVFPLPLNANYSYNNNWGTARGFGGRRAHEGCDIFANHGIPVRSVCYGYVEVKGWNRFGGWRIGIRDLNNVYHYYAHLGGYNKKIKVGDVVTPGEVVGWVGSSGYGSPGTSGKFPPHLHYGMYKDNGNTEWAFDPYPYLKKWEREEARRKNQK